MAIKNHTKRKAKIQFADLVTKMEHYLIQLKSIDPFVAATTGLQPLKGVYVFYERGRPLYVGRTDNIRRRMAQHRNSGSRHNDAPFAYLLAKQAAAKAGFDTNQTRTSLCNDDVFKAHFSAAKSRVGKMLVRFIEISDPREQSLFEYYASIELHTPWNDHSNS